MKKLNPKQMTYSQISEVGRVTPHDLQLFEKKQNAEIKTYLQSPKAFDAYLKSKPHHSLEIYSDGGQVKFVQPSIKSKQNICIHDFLNFTCNEESYNRDIVITDADLILQASSIIKSIFGFGISVIRASGAFFYTRSYELGDNYGLVCHGGQNSTLLVSINGTGLSQATPNWEVRLYRFLQSAIQPSITRVDLAHDMFDAPLFTVDHYLREYEKAKFTNYSKAPKVGQAGNWLTANDDGRTLYIGKRTNGLFCRIYEKGLQLKSKEKPTWVRIEVELKSVDRIIPLEVLLFPDQFLAGSFPAFRFISQSFKRIQTYQHEVKADLIHREKWAKRQTGGFIKLLSELGYSPDEIIKMLEGDKVPKPFQKKFLENSKQSICETPASQDANTNPLDDFLNNDEV